MVKVNRIEAKEISGPRSLLRSYGRLRLMTGLLTLGVVSGCLSRYHYDMNYYGRQFNAYLEGDTDELPADLPPSMAEEWRQYRRDNQALAQKLRAEERERAQLAEKAGSAQAQARQESASLPDGYSEPLADALIARSVVVTAEVLASSFSADLSAAADAVAPGQSAVKAQMESMQKSVDAYAERQASSQAGMSKWNRWARVGTVRALLAGKVFRQILPTDDPSSPLVTDDALLLHVKVSGGSEKNPDKQLWGDTPFVLWERNTGVLRDATGKQGQFELKVVHPLHPGTANAANVDAWRQKLQGDIERTGQALGPAILKCYGEMK